MTHTYWNDWYVSWGWCLWCGIIFLMFSSLGNWGYTYGAHRKYGLVPQGRAVDILNERYARGDISREEYGRLKAEITTP
jgi:putative membrane protein